MNKVLLTIIAVIGVISLSLIGLYNGLLAKDEAVKREWGNLESTLQRRLDLIPNLVEVVKGYAKYESDTLQKVMEARANATAIKIDSSMLDNPEALKKYQQVQSELGSNLSRLIAVAENYPDLKASNVYRDLMAQLEGTENRINIVRQNYNAEIKEYNYAIRKFPTSVVNKMFLNLPVKNAFSAEPAAGKATKIDLSK